MMNRLLFIFLLFSVPTFLYAQENVFKVDCGRDTSFCVGTNRCGTCYFIGTRVKLSNGVTPFHFAWSCKPLKITSKVTFTASDYLNDTTVVNPCLKGFGVQNKPWRFYLTVKDYNNKVSTDSLDIQCSTFMFSTYEINLTLNQGDSIQFHSDTFVGGGIPPIKYYWTPEIGLSDSSRIDTWCKPAKTISYKQYVIDSEGCKSDPNLGINVRVIPTFVDNKFNNQQLCLSKIGNTLHFNNNQEKIATISFYSIDGRLLHQSRIQEATFDIPKFESKAIKICTVEIGKRKETIKVFSEN